MERRRLTRRVLSLFTAATFAMAGVGSAQENIGKVSQPLVGGTVVDAAHQEEMTLLTFQSGSGSCSASLLRNNWAITAAHCVEVPDPAKPGQVMLIPETSVTLTANWKTVQNRQSMRIITFRPVDVAIIRVATPFSVYGSTTRHNQNIFREGQFPYFGSLVPVSISVFGRGISQFATGSGASAVPSSGDGQFRVGYFKTQRVEDNWVWYPSTAGQSIAGGDSGGPSFARVLAGDVLLGVHSNCHTQCAPGKVCGTWKGPGPAPANYSPWMWVSATPECADAPIAPVWDDINRYLGAFTSEKEPALEPPPPGFIGTFGTTPQNYQPIWVYAITNAGDMLWYRKDTGTAGWQGAKKVGNGWNFKDVIPAGGNAFYALTQDGKLLWYRHDGFNDGSFSWKGPVEVGHGWTFSKIFSGGDGVVYAIKDDGTLLWYRHGGYADGGGMNTWTGPKVVGSGWGEFKDVFSSGDGAVYAVRPDGQLVLYQQIGFATGEKSWKPARTVGTGWAGFKQIIPAGGGVILAIQNDGKLLWYKHYGLVQENRIARIKEKWDGPVTIGSGWFGFQKVVALIPSAPSVVR